MYLQPFEHSKKVRIFYNQGTNFHIFIELFTIKIFFWLIFLPLKTVIDTCFKTKLYFHIFNMFYLHKKILNGAIVNKNKTFKHLGSFY